MSETEQGRRETLTTRLGRRLRRFRGDETGSVTIQVIFFSLMVFGTTGLVLDAGRVYDSHTEMQIYADQMALRAAAELDRKADSIERAAAAVYGDNGLTLRWQSEADKKYKVDRLAFYSGMASSDADQNDMSVAFPLSMNVADVTASTSNADEAASEAATHVVVSVSANINAVTRYMTQTIVSIGKPHATDETRTDQIGKTSYDLGAAAAATLDIEYCAELSSLVMCNPWEDQPDSSNPLLVDKDDSSYSIPGRSLFYFAPNFSRPGVPTNRIVTSGEDHGSLFPWDVNHQVFQVHDDGSNPATDPSGVCSGDFLRDLSGNVLSGSATPQQYQEARDRCLMARATAPEVCWGPDDPLSIRPASGDTVLRSVNTIFDIWMEPFESILEDTRTVANVVMPDGTSRSVRAASFFEPDILATTTYETADRFSARPASAGVYAGEVDPADGTIGTSFDCQLPPANPGDPENPLSYLVEVDGVLEPILLQDNSPDYNTPWPCDDRLTDTGNNVGIEDHSENAVLDSFQPAYDTIPRPGWSYVAGTRGEGIGYDFCHDKTLGRQDTARQELRFCISEASSADLSSEQQAAALQACQDDYGLSSTFAVCSEGLSAQRAREQCGCEIDFIGDHHIASPPIYMYARTLGHRNRQYNFAGNPNDIFPVSPQTGPNSWYEFYKLEREAQSEVTTQGERSRVVFWNGVDPVNPGDPPNYVERYALTPGPDGHSEPRAGYIKHYPDDFLALTGHPHSSTANLSEAFITPDRERRRIKSAMVNCGVVSGTVRDEDGTFRTANADGNFDVRLEDMRIMDAYIPNPAGIFCGEGDVTCDIAGSVETSMYIELIEDVTEESTAQQFAVRLVR